MRNMKDYIQFDTLAAWRELWLYLNSLMNGRKIPVFIKYSVGEDILRDFMKVGQKLDLSNKVKNSRPSRAKQLAYEASDLYDHVKFAIDQLIDSGYIRNEPEKALSPSPTNKHKIYENKQREHLSRLREDFGNKLGGWLRSFHPAG